MLSTREDAIEFIKTVPDNKMIYIMNLFNGIKGLLDESTPQEPSASIVDELYGMCKNSTLTVERFLAMTHDETEMRE